MHRLLLLVLVMACGGNAAPAPAAPAADPAPPRATRVIVEDDSEPEEGVQFINARGRMDPAVIQVGIAPHTQALSECYTSNLQRRRWLGGRVVIHWDISKEGVVTAVRLAESTLGAWPIERCLLEVARAAAFDRPVGGDADFQLPLEFSAKGRAIAWDEDKALRAVGGQVASLAACADGNGAGKHRGKGKHRPQAPKIVAPTDVTLTVYIGPGGKPQSVGFASAAVLDEAWAECAERSALAWRLPDPRGQIAKLVVRYPAK